MRLWAKRIGIGLLLIAASPFFAIGLVLGSIGACFAAVFCGISFVVNLPDSLWGAVDILRELLGEGKEVTEHEQDHP